MTTINKYKTIMADPPWETEQRGKSRGAVNHYALMGLERIKALPVERLCADDAHCWLWVTNASLRHGYEVLDAWGFVPRGVLTWVKPRLGLGRYLRNASEHLLLGTRGSAPVGYNGQPSWMFAPVQEHSHKPEEQFAVIERISLPPYLELFARRPRFGWDMWGDEVASDIEIEGYPVPRYSARYGHYMERQAEQAARDEQDSCTGPTDTAGTPGQTRGRYE
jgi:N6-adenosine-specific RNA methylase IME4